MRRRWSCDLNGKRRGFSLTELLVSLAIIIVIFGLALTVISQSRASAQSIACIAQLRSISISFSQYARDNLDRFPDPASMQRSWESCLHDYISDLTVFACPSDQEVYPSVGSSYDWRDTGNPATTMAGKTLSDCNRSSAVLAFETLPGWHLKNAINASLFDGSACTMSSDDCLGDLQTPIRVMSP